MFKNTVLQFRNQSEYLEARRFALKTDELSDYFQRKFIKKFSHFYNPYKKCGWICGYQSVPGAMLEDYQTIKLSKFIALAQEIYAAEQEVKDIRKEMLIK